MDTVYQSRCMNIQSTILLKNFNLWNKFLLRSYSINNYYYFDYIQGVSNLKRKKRCYMKSVNKRNRRLPSRDVTLFCLYMWYFCPTRLFNFTVVLTLSKTTNQARISSKGLFSISVLHLQWQWRVLPAPLPPFFWWWLGCWILSKLYSPRIA